VRLRVPENQQIIFKDMVRDLVSFEASGVGDFVIVKSDGMPVYNYAVVIDDACMHITHVIRAEEHLSNTPRQILLYEALGLATPIFGHISLILGKDRSKMSKRHGATSVEQDRNLGYFPEAIVNFLALLGWAPVGEQEIFSLEELVEQFSMDRVAKNPAVFDIDKLNWINAHYMKKANPELITEMALPHLQAAGYIGDEVTLEQKSWLVQVVSAVQEQLSYAAQIVDYANLFFNDNIEFENEEAHEVLHDEAVPQVVELFRNKMLALETVDATQIKALLKSITKELKLGGKKVFMPIRVMLTGNMHGPDLDRLITVIGKERTLSRLTTTLSKI
jgi:nondiscriminating glutamyl-tRNA synthetase